MKNIVKSLVVASLVASSGAHADNAYVSTSGGIGKIPTVTSNQDFPLLLKSPGIFTTQIDSNSLTFKNSQNLNAAIGYRFGNFRVEINPILLKAKFKAFHQKPYELIARDNLSGNSKVLATLINGYANISLTESILPYLGIGFGYAKVKNELKHAGLIDVVNGNTVNLPVLKLTMRDKSPIYQLVAGSLFKVNQSVGVTLDYRYLSTTKKINAFNNIFKNHSINLGVMYAF